MNRTPLMNERPHRAKTASPGPMSVLELMNFAAPYPGNFFRSLSALEKEISARRGSVVYVMPERAAGLEWVETEMRAGKKILFLPRERLQAEKTLKDIIKSRGINIVHSHFIDAGMYIPLRLARLRYRRAAHIFHAHSTPRFRIGGPADFVRKHLVGAQQYLCVSPDVAARYTRGGRRCRVVPNAVDFARLEVKEPAAQAFDGIPAGKKAVLMFGYNFEIKGIDYVLKALEECDAGHEYTLMICAAGHTGKAQEGVVELLGAVPEWVKILPAREDIAAYYAAADLFVSASRTEGMSYAVIEAAYCGLPIVLSDIEANKAVGLPHAEFFKTQDGRSFYGALGRAAGLSPEEMGLHAAENKCYCLERFGLDAWANSVADILQTQIK